MAFWLFKSEPHTFSIADLASAPKQIAGWEGVRNYQARNMLRDECKIEDGILFYHSSCAQPAIVGTAKIVRAGYIDPTQFDPQSPYYDARSLPLKPRWYQVDIQLQQIFSSTITLTKLRTYPQLQQLKILQRGNRLSITPIQPAEWHFILNLAKESQHV